MKIICIYPPHKVSMLETWGSYCLHPIHSYPYPFYPFLTTYKNQLHGETPLATELFGDEVFQENSKWLENDGMWWVFQITDKNGLLFN